MRVTRNGRMSSPNWVGGLDTRKFSGEPHVAGRARQYCVLLLWLQGALVGVFAALDLVLFTLFLELSLVPLFLLIGTYGGERRIAAAFRYFVFSAAGGLLLLAAVLWMLHRTGTSSFEALLTARWTSRQELLLFLAFATGLAMKTALRFMYARRVL